MKFCSLGIYDQNTIVTETDYYISAVDISMDHLGLVESLENFEKRKLRDWMCLFNTVLLIDSKRTPTVYFQCQGKRIDWKIEFRWNFLCQTLSRKLKQFVMKLLFVTAADDDELGGAKNQDQCQWLNLF